jgi:thyrotropin-releasing hormone receptor
MSADKSAAENDRTTTMLVLVVLMFVGTELPQGVLALLSGFDSRIFDNVYVPLGDVLDLLVLINSSVNFILYCVMSTQFRSTFWAVFIARCCDVTNRAKDGACVGDGRKKSQFTVVYTCE